MNGSQRFAPGLMILIFLTSAPATAKPRSAPMILALAQIAGCGSVDAAELRACARREVAARTVRVLFANGSCSGVLVDARTVRTAGHCFTEGGRFKGVAPAAGPAWRALYRWRFAMGPESDVHVMDQAEIVADRDLKSLPRLSVAAFESRAVGRGAWTAGYPRGGAFEVGQVRVTDAWRGRPAARVGLMEVTGRAHWTVRDGFSGGPTFAAEGCALKLVGTTLGISKARLSLIQSITPAARFVSPRSSPDTPLRLKARREMTARAGDR